MQLKLGFKIVTDTLWRWYQIDLLYHWLTWMKQDTFFLCLGVQIYPLTSKSFHNSRWILSCSCPYSTVKVALTIKFTYCECSWIRNTVFSGKKSSTVSRGQFRSREIVERVGRLRKIQNDERRPCSPIIISSLFTKMQMTGLNSFSVN
jgi:hypothetical protein